MAEFAATVDLATLGPAQGFVIRGETENDTSGFRVADAGDINGDGIADLAVTAPQRDVGGEQRGAAYIVFGKTGGYAALDLGALDPSAGFSLVETPAATMFGSGISGAGDVNGDGIDDFIIGAQQGDSPGHNNDGRAYVVFGKRGDFGATIDPASLNGATGFKIVGGFDGAQAGVSVSGGGDVNGDGFADMIVGASGASAAYVIYGRSSFSATPLDLSTLPASRGFSITGVPGTEAGVSVSSLGDINNDGFDDLIVGAAGEDSGGTNAGSAYVVFGKAGGLASINVSQLNGTNGFRIQGDDLNDRLGTSVSEAGDVNGDGFADLIIGSGAAGAGSGNTNGAAYVLFGKATGFAATVDLSSIGPATGFAIAGQNGLDFFGQYVSSAGDVNGDGFDDLIIAAPGYDAFDLDRGGSGAAYVLFGRAAGLDNVAPGELDGSNGFRIVGSAFGEQAGQSVSAAGDVNNDGFDDIIIGAIQNDANGTLSGASYVIYGHRADEAVNRIGTNIGQTINGGRGADTIDARGGDDTLNGWEGADVLTGGTGDDTYILNDARTSGFPIATLTYDSVVEAASGGTDTVRVMSISVSKTASSYRLGDNVENGVITGDKAFSLIGNTLGNVLTGNAAANRLDGGAGADSLRGGSGDDTYVVDSAGDVVSEGVGRGTDTVLASVNHTLSANVENLTLTGAGNIDGVGNASANVITGNGGDNVLTGGGGNDRLVGGLGDDVYGVDSAGDRVIEAANGGSDTVVSTVTHTLAANVENLRLSGAAEIDGTGNGAANAITGNAAANVINGGAGADTLAGGGGNDIYFVDNRLDRVAESANAGTDLVSSSVSLALSSNVENLTLTGTTTINGVGNTLVNAIRGNAGDNVIDGKAGSDVIRGEGGRDTFTFTTALGPNNIDRILDFSVADDGFRLDNAVFTGLGVGPLSPDAFRTGATATDATDRIIYNSATGALLFDRDGVGGAAAQQFASVNAGLAISAADFAIV